MDKKLIFQISSQFLKHEDCLKLLILNHYFRKYEKNGWLFPSN